MKPEVKVVDRMWCCPSCGCNGFRPYRGPWRIPVLGIMINMRQITCSRCGTQCRPRPLW